MMQSNIAATSGIALVLALTLGLAGCAQGASQSSAGATGSAAAAAASGESASIDKAREILMSAKDTPYKNLTFDVSTESTATAINNGEAQQQSLTTSMKGQLDKSGDTEKAHIAYTSTSTNEIGKITYDMYLDGDNVIVEQNGVLFTDAAEGTAKSYRDAVTSAMREEDIEQILNMAASCKVDTSDGKTTVTVTADPKKVTESNFIDTESLPEGSSIATLVASFTVDASNHIETVRVMSSTSGTPTYRVNETYRYSNYDATELPAWPDIRAYALEQMGIHVAEDGTMTFTDDAGDVYTIDSIDEDGTIHYSIGGESGEFSVLAPITETEEQVAATPSAQQQTQSSATQTTQSSGSSPTPADPAAFAEGGSTEQSGASFGEGTTGNTGPADATSFAEGTAPSSTTTNTSQTGTSTSTGTGTSTAQTDSASQNNATAETSTPTSTNTANTGGNTSSEQGRAYITADDGTIHYLDEPGSRLIENGDGTRYFIDANGSFYFLQG